MSWSISTKDISRISTFDQAERIWNNAVPWRNERDSWRQLGDRRMEHKRLVKLSDERGYECVLFNTPVVTYLADGSVKLCCYDSASTQYFARCVKPKGCAPTSVRGRMIWNVKTDDGDMFFREDREALHLKPTEKGNWLLLNESELFEEQKYVPKAGAQVRRMLKGYRTWYDMTKRLGVPLPVYSPKYHRVDHSVDAFFTEPDGPPSDQFMMIANQLGDPDVIQTYLYKTRGAHIKVPAPFNRLPRIST